MRNTNTCSIWKIEYEGHLAGCMGKGYGVKGRDKMEHNEQRVWMIKELLSEEEDYRGYQIPKEEQEQKNLLRALMNV